MFKRGKLPGPCKAKASYIYIYIYIYPPHLKVDREEDVYTAILFKTQQHRSEIEGKERIYKSHYRKDKIH